MMSISETRQSSDPTAASPAAAQEPVTGRTPNAWAAGRGDEFQSDTFRAMAWSQADDSLAEPLPYIGDEYSVSAEYSVPRADSGPAARIADATEPPSTPRYRRSTLLYGIAAGFAAAAVGGLLLTVVNAHDEPKPTTISTKATEPATNVVKSQPTTEPVPIRPSSPAPVKVAEAPARVVPSAVAPSRAFAAPAPAPQTSSAPEAAAPEPAAPEAAAPEVAAPEAAPQAAAPEFTAPDAKPPVWVPPVTPQQVPHPVGPQTFHVPPVTGPIHVPTVGDPTISLPAAPDAPAAANPVITLKPGFTVPQIIPTFSGGAGQ